MTIPEFNEILWSYYAEHARANLPWRVATAQGIFNPYHILVSEIMLQQTQVARVTVKYEAWLQVFPDIETLAKAPLSDVLTMWSGLGYNRRAKFLHQAARCIVDRHAGVVPSEMKSLIALPGVGKNTAGAILAYAHNQPIVFIETNIRTVFLHHFFSDKEEVDDKDIIELIENAIDTENPREWYWALMDYGTHIKRERGNFARLSKHHVRQSRFKGSRREVRGMVLKRLIAGNGSVKVGELTRYIKDERLDEIVVALEKEGLIKISRAIIKLAD
jgi:A/G-specific adenine glycosylase